MLLMLPVSRGSTGLNTQMQNKFPTGLVQLSVLYVQSSVWTQENAFRFSAESNYGIWGLEVTRSLFISVRNNGEKIHCSSN